uniref:PH domain-containing protein n=1 Tax=Scylla olivacea TaxID=85551 RepID=A0A0P4VWL0_SCYOL
MSTLSKKSHLPCNVTMGLHEGTLHLRRKGALKKSKEYYATLVATSYNGVARLECYENEKHSLSLQPTFMVLGSDVVKVERITLPEKEMRNAFLISTRNQHYTFFVSTSRECDLWVDALQKTLFEGVQGPRHILLKDRISATAVNEVYESVDQVSPQKTDFLVKSDETTQARLGVYGSIKLVVEDESISLITPSYKMVVRWSLKDIRKFTVTSETFSLEAGRKSALGEGVFTFLTEEYASRSVNPSTSSDATYESIEELMISSNTKQRPSPAGNICPQQLALSNQDGHSTGTSVVPTRCCWSSPNSQDINSSAVNNHNTQVITGQRIIDQVPIYSEPEMITNAWKSHGYNGSDGEESLLYSNLEFTQSQKEENHYWVGGAARASVDVRQEKQDIQEESLYAVVDLSKKHKNK